MWWDKRWGTRRMKRTHMASAANPKMAAPSAATPSMTRGRDNRAATTAPSHRPAYDAPHANTGVKSHPSTTSRWASQRGTAVPSSFALALPGERDDGEQRDHDGERESGRERQRPGHASEPGDRDDEQRPDDRGQRPPRERRLGARRLPCRDDATRPGEERAQHPPDRQIPPRAPAADRVPRPGVRLQRAEHDDVDRHEH